MIRKRLFGIVLGILLLSGTAAPAAAQEPVKIAYGSISGSYTALWVADETGAFKEVGLPAKVVYIGSGTLLTQALVAGDVQIGFPNGAAVIRAAQSGSNLVIIGIAVDRMIFSMIARPDIHSVADLKGKKLGVTRFGSSTDISARIALQRKGLRPEKDVVLLQMGGISQIFAGLQAGAIDAGILSPPTMWRAEKMGLHEILDITAMNIPFPNPAIATSKTFVQDHPREMYKFMEAYALGAKRMKTEPAVTKKILMKYTRTQDPEILERVYKFYALRILQKAPYIPLAAIEGAIDDVARKDPKVKSVPATTFYNDRFVKELETSGYLKKLYP